MSDCKNNSACMDRRDFLVKAGILAGGGVLTISALGTSAFAGTFDDVTIDVAADSPLAKAGGSQIVDSSAGQIIVINEGDGKYGAFSARCTHKGGTVGYDAAAKKLVCPKHGSAFDGSTGAVVNGPADSPLKSFPAKGSGSKVTISVA
jgi:nitrite reductase/ring-hydroxylating ferredoxin subunit